MTLIAGYTDGETWAIGGDSGAFDEDGLFQLVATPKVWRADGSLIGGAGSFYANEVAQKSKIGDPYLLRNRLMEANVPGTWSLLVVTKLGLFEVSDDFSVVEHNERYGAVGPGNALAIGAFSAMPNDIGPFAAVKSVMRIVSQHHTSAVPPFKILKAGV